MGKKKVEKKEEEILDEFTSPGDSPKEVPLTNNKSSDVVLSKEQFENVLARLDSQDNEIKRLSKAADKGRLSEYDNKHAPKGPRTYGIGLFKGSIIVGWKTVQNECIKNPSTGKIETTQIYDVDLFDPKTKKTETIRLNDYKSFSDLRFHQFVKAEEVKSWIDKDTELEMVKLEIVEKCDCQGVVFEIAKLYVN